MRRAALLLLVLLAAASTAVAIGLRDRFHMGAPEFRVFAEGLGSVSGISYDGDALWITADGAPVIRRVDARTGEVLRSIPFATPQTGGSAWDGRTLWQIAYIEKTVYAVDPSTGEATPAFRTPGDGMCAGMTYDGEHLWIANFEEGRIYRVDTRGRVIGSVSGSPETTGLAWDGTHLWTGVLPGTKSHDEVTPYTGFVQKLAVPERAPLQVWAVPGVGPGTSDWIPGARSATRFWWYDGFHQRIVQVDIPRTPIWPAALMAAAALLALGLALSELGVLRARDARSRDARVVAARVRA